MLRITTKIKKLQLTQEIKTNIDKYARDSCYHPSDQIAYVRYAFSNTQQRHVWQGKTTANYVEDLSEKWFELNIRFALNNYYVKQLELMLNDSSNSDIPWSPLPIGSSTNLSKLSSKKKRKIVSRTKHKKSLDIRSSAETKEDSKLKSSSKTNSNLKTNKDVKATAGSKSNDKNIQVFLSSSSSSDSESSSESDVSSESNDNIYTFKYLQKD